MTKPIVSVCLPSLNTFPYLQERIDTILGQTYGNLEVIVVDSYSDDGSWEFFQKVGRSDSRLRISQFPRGLYESWNRCVELAHGDYIYIATSDDTMASDCLEKLVGALEQHPDCDLAHCNLVILDESGQHLPEPDWRRDCPFSFGNPDLLKRKHLRRAPIDGVLHLTGRMVYQSVTELLIRRSLFDRIGGFRPDWGSIGDFYWNAKAGLIASCVHVPDTWASWRMHGTQLTTRVNFSSPDHFRMINSMIESAVQDCEALLSPRTAAALREDLLPSSRDLRAHYWGLLRRGETTDRRLFQIGELTKSAVRKEVLERLRGKPKWADGAPQKIANWCESLGFGPAIEFVS